MPSITRKSFDTPDEKRTPPSTTVDVVRMGEVSIARITMQPGWRWSEHVAPVVGTESCQAGHVGTVLSGNLHTVHDDGTVVDFGPGDVYTIEPGHDGWVVGDEPVVVLEFESAESYAKG